MKKLIFFLGISFCLQGYSQSEFPKYKASSIVIEIETPTNYKEPVNLGRYSLQRTPTVLINPSKVDLIEPLAVNGKLKWVMSETKPVLVSINPFSYFHLSYSVPYVLEPGDSVHINYREKMPVFSGRGSAKLQLSYELNRMVDSLKATGYKEKISHISAITRSYQEFQSYYFYFTLVGVTKPREKEIFFKDPVQRAVKKEEDPTDRFYELYDYAVKKYKGLILEETLAELIGGYYGLIKEVRFNKKSEALLAKYYSRPVKYPYLLKNVKKVEQKYRQKVGQRYAPVMTASGTDGKKVSLTEIGKNKTMVLDFWFTGCTGCVQMAPVLRKIEEQFKSDSNVVFVSVSIDKDKSKWLKSIREKKFTTGTSLQVYTDGKGDAHDIIKELDVEGYPTLIVLDPAGQYLSRNKREYDPRTTQGNEKLVALLKKQAVVMKDGPYVFYDGNDAKSYGLMVTIKTVPYLQKTARQS